MNKPKPRRHCVYCGTPLRKGVRLSTRFCSQNCSNWHRKQLADRSPDALFAEAMNGRDFRDERLYR